MLFLLLSAIQVHNEALLPSPRTNDIFSISAFDGILALIPDHMSFILLLKHLAWSQ